MLAGSLYLVIGLAQALTRPGFDLTRHELSQLALGDWGWVQISNFFVAGLLVIASAVGMQRALRTGRGATWVPRLVGLYGVGLLGAAIFTADAGLGFPLGTPPDAVTISSHGILHLAFAAVRFCGLIAASIIFGRRDLSSSHTELPSCPPAVHFERRDNFFAAIFVAVSSLFRMHDLRLLNRL